MPIIILVIICLAKDMSEIMVSFEKQGLKGKSSSIENLQESERMDKILQYQALVSLISYILICLAMMLTIFDCKVLKRSHNFVPI